MKPPAWHPFILLFLAAAAFLGLSFVAMVFINLGLYLIGATP
jgi:hypothetical protein